MAPERQSWDSRGLAFQSLHVSPWWFSGSNLLFQPHILLTSSVSTSPTHCDSATQCSSAFANIPCVSEEHGISTILGHTTWGCLEHSGPAAWVFAHIIFSNFHILSGLRSICSLVYTFYKWIHCVFWCLWNDCKHRFPFPFSRLIKQTIGGMFL